MKISYKKIYLALLSTSLLMLLPSETEAFCWNPCKWNFCNQTVEVGADYILWKPCVDDLDYAAEVKGSSSNTTVHYKGICPKWESGVRGYIALLKFARDWDLITSYTYLNSETTSHIEFKGTPSTSIGIASPLIHPDVIPPTLFQSARGHFSFTYQEGDLLVSYDISSTPNHVFSPYFGVAGIYFQQDLKANFHDSGFVKWTSNYWGVGLRAGSGYTFKIDERLSLFADANGTLLAGDADSKNNQEFSTSIFLKDNDCCLFVPGYHISAGVVYNACICGMDFAVRCGYEFLNWYNVPNQRVFSGNDGNNAELSHSSSASTRTLGFHGLLAGITLEF